MYYKHHKSQSMKNFGSKSEYHQERTRDLLRAYFRCLETCDVIRMSDVFKRVVEMPASRFWVSIPRASVVVSSIDHGDQLSYMCENKRAMFFEIHRRVCALREKYPTWSLRRLVDHVISQPAPRFYIAPGSAKVLVLKARKIWFAEKSKRLRAY
jgi:hypothetical protein